MAVPRPDSVQAIAARLRLIRIAYGVVQARTREMSQSEFSRLCDFTVQNWHNAENAANRIGVDTAMKVMRRTGATLDYIYYGNPAGLPHALAVEIEKLEKQEAPRQTKRA